MLWKDWAYRKMMPDFHRSMSGMGALENGVRTLAAADAGHAGHAHVFIAAKRSDSHHLGGMGPASGVNLRQPEPP